MVDPNKPMVDTRSMVTGQAQTPTYEPQGSNEPPAAQPQSDPNNVTPPQSGGSSSSSQTTTRRITTLPPEFKGSSYDELLPWLEQYLKDHKPMTKEEEEKLKRKQRTEGIISGIADAAQAVSNLFFTSQYAPNMYNAKEGLSAKAKARFDKEKAERDADNDKFFDYAIKYGSLKNADKEYGLKVWETEHQLDRERIADDRFDADIAHRDKREAIDDKRYDEGIAHRDKREAVEDDHWDKGHAEQVRHNKASESLQSQQIAVSRENAAISRAQLNYQMKQGNVPFALGSGKGTVTVPANALTTHNVAYVFSKLPLNVQNSIDRKPIYKKGRGGKQEIVGYTTPTMDDMLYVIANNIEGNVNAQNALREIAGQKVQPSTDNTPPSRRSAPSRR